MLRQRTDHHRGRECCVHHPGLRLCHYLDPRPFRPAWGGMGAGMGAGRLRAPVGIYGVLYSRSPLQQVQPQWHADGDWGQVKSPRARAWAWSLSMVAAMPALPDEADDGQHGERGDGIIEILKGLVQPGGRAPMVAQHHADIGEQECASDYAVARAGARLARWNLTVSPSPAASSPDHRYVRGLCDASQTGFQRRPRLLLPDPM